LPKGTFLLCTNSANAAACATAGLALHDMAMEKTGNAARVARARSKLKAQGLRPIQIWAPDIRAPGFAEELARQCRAEAEWQASPKGRAEMAFWDEVASEAWTAS
jgi:Protein  of unknown function (DUF3018)